jgi:gamma-glutamyltranspeptidase/glutathione hydrolase
VGALIGVPRRRGPAAVAAGHRATVAAAAEVLRAGGNAVDAAVAAGCAAAVAEPFLTSLAGGGFMALRTAEGEEVVLDFFCDVPGRGAPRPHDPARLEPVPIHFGPVVQDFHVGPASVAVPGVLGGYLHAHRRWGRLDLARVVAPSVELAGRGIVADGALERFAGLLAPVMARTEAGRELFWRQGRPLAAGDRFSNPALAEFLSDVGAGRRRAFRPSELGGNVTEDDLAAHAAVERPPLEVGLPGALLLTNPPPSFGGSLVAHGLEVLAGGTGPGPTLGYDLGTVDGVAALADALVSMAEHRRRLGEGTSRGTTHVSVADGEGNLVAMTTSNGSGSGEFAPGLGVQLNNMLGEEDLHPGGFGALAAGTRIGSMMAPSLLRLADRFVALGSGGSERIRSVLLQLVLRLHAGAAVAAAVDAPRLHWDGAALQAEPGWPEPALEVLGLRRPLVRWQAPDVYFGGAHLVDTRGGAAGDRRRGGAAVVLARL